MLSVRHMKGERKTQKRLSEEEELDDLSDICPDVLTEEELEKLSDTDMMFYGSWLAGVTSSKGPDYVRRHRKKLRVFLSKNLNTRIVP